jgi:hypothetical protein
VSALRAERRQLLRVLRVPRVLRVLRVPRVLPRWVWVAFYLRLSFPVVSLQLHLPAA